MNIAEQEINKFRQAISSKGKILKQIIQLTKELATVDVSELSQQLIKRKQLKAENRYTEVTAKPLQALGRQVAEQNSKATSLNIRVANRGLWRSFCRRCNSRHIVPAP